jgi:hypothetical protein
MSRCGRRSSTSSRCGDGWARPGRCSSSWWPRAARAAAHGRRATRALGARRLTGRARLAHQSGLRGRVRVRQGAGGEASRRRRARAGAAGRAAAVHLGRALVAEPWHSPGARPVSCRRPPRPVPSCHADGLARLANECLALLTTPYPGPSSSLWVVRSVVISTSSRCPRTIIRKRSRVQSTGRRGVNRSRLRLLRASRRTPSTLAIQTSPQDAIWMPSLTFPGKSARPIPGRAGSSHRPPAHSRPLRRPRFARTRIHRRARACRPLPGCCAVICRPRVAANWLCRCSERETYRGSCSHGRRRVASRARSLRICAFAVTGSQQKARRP